MSASIKNTLKEEYKRLKKALEKVVKTKKEQAMPQLVLQPVRNRPRMIK